MSTASVARGAIDHDAALKTLSKYTHTPSVIKSHPNSGVGSGIVDTDKQTECGQFIPQQTAVKGPPVGEQLVHVCSVLEQQQVITRNMSNILAKVGSVKDLLEKRVVQAGEQVDVFKDAASHLELSNHIDVVEKLFEEKISDRFQSLQDSMTQLFDRAIQSHLDMFLQNVKSELALSQEYFESKYSSLLLQVDEKLSRALTEYQDQQSSRIDQLSDKVAADKQQLIEHILTHRNQLHTVLSTSRDIALEKLKSEIRSEYILTSQLHGIRKELEEFKCRGHPSPKESFPPTTKPSLSNSVSIPIKHSVTSSCLDIPQPSESALASKEAAIIDLTLSDSENQSPIEDNAELSVPAKRPANSKTLQDVCIKKKKTRSATRRNK